jgi:hypothetical protein
MRSSDRYPPFLRTHHVAPELFIKTVRWSIRFLTSVTRLSQPFLSFRSATMYSHFPGPSLLSLSVTCFPESLVQLMMARIIFRTCFNSDSFLLAIITLAPFWTKAWAAISPNPDAPPVIKATSFEKSKSLDTLRSASEVIVAYRSVY